MIWLVPLPPSQMMRVVRVWWVLWAVEQHWPIRWLIKYSLPSCPYLSSSITAVVCIALHGPRGFFLFHSISSITFLSFFFFINFSIFRFMMFYTFVHTIFNIFFICTLNIVELDLIFWNISLDPNTVKLEVRGDLSYFDKPEEVNKVLTKNLNKKSSFIYFDHHIF